MNAITEHRPLDHKRLVLRRKTEVARALRLYGEMQGVNQMTILHEADDSCCKRESWQQTMAWILAHLKKRTLYVNPYVAETQDPHTT